MKDKNEVKYKKKNLKREGENLNISRLPESILNNFPAGSKNTKTHTQKK
jgi:hypothetical protein